MDAEIINVGTDLINGDRLDYNSKYILKSMSNSGVEVNWQTNIRGKLGLVSKALTTASYRSRLIIVIGGLGPFQEDVTKEAFCRTFNLKLVLNKESLSKIKKHYAELGKDVPKSVIGHAYVPKGCSVIPNETGLTPGCFITIGESQFVLLPGNFSEMKNMFDKYILPDISEISNKFYVSKTVNVVLPDRYIIEEKLRSVFALSNPKVSLYEENNEYKIKIICFGESSISANNLCDSVANKIKILLGENVYGEDYNSITQKTVELLKKRHLTVSTAESCTGGLVSSLIVSEPGASEVFELGTCTYSNRMKTLALDVNSKTVRSHGAVSGETAAEMAIGMQKLSNASVAISVTGVAGPAESENKPAGLVYLGLCNGEKVWVFKLKVNMIKPERNAIRNITAITAIDILRRYLIKSKNIVPFGSVIGEPINVIDYKDCVEKTIYKFSANNNRLKHTEKLFSDGELSDFINETFKSY